MSNVIVFANQKGGVGKTTSAVNIGASLAEKDQKVLLIDFDPQGNLSSSVGLFNNEKTIYSALAGQFSINEVIHAIPEFKLDVIPATIDLSAASLELADQEKREYFLKELLDPIKERYDFILIDCPPSLDLLTINGIVASDAIIIPVQCEFFAAQGFLTLLFNTISRIKQRLNPKLHILGVIFTMYDSRTRLAQEVIEMVVEKVGDPSLFFKTVIPRNVKLAEAPSHSQPVTQYASASSGAERYRNLAQEVLERVKK
ncbi:ParA family protein [Entomospira culicis]|uniref:ParA family protein n=1 Tax=Entomospira culicis TaxID=2719989 RepID=A0A968GHI3_9SPIO|nr:AAA family ATPase [Entomospira culicis]NIZ18874.1 ParA family protein [Entomospira culicis]NIZ69089.1 ParA family protein [Entomospira culicis]WDI37676.1 AAA family ATPase [Entomospira culicis]WDI39304.1 AAA family ATPase [Entomospira culicis]